MPDPTLDPQAVIPAIPMGEEAYDRIMAGIEPELLSESLKTLKDKYKDETPQQAAERSERYTKAFLEFDKQFAAVKSDWQNAAESFEKDALRSIEKEDRDQEAADMSALEQTISTQ
jgi:hypothetical protein